MKRKLMFAVIAVMLAATLIGGATFALFTGSTTNAANTFQAGTVVVNAGEPSYSQQVDIANLAPGDVVEGEFQVSNDGTLPLWFKVTPETAGDLFSGEFAACVEVTDPATQWTALNNDSTFTVKYKVHYPIGATVQAQSGTLRFLIDAEQLPHNPKNQLGDYTGQWNMHLTETDAEESFAFAADGWINLTQTGNVVNGTFGGDELASGTIEGTVDGNVMTGIWHNEWGYTADLNFTMYIDGNKFSGVWTIQPGQGADGEHGTMDGTRVI
ncbi:MAG: TasA family protein [Ignavibacteriales bacterium]